MLAERLLNQRGYWIDTRVKSEYDPGELKKAGYDCGLELRGFLRRIHEMSFDKALTEVEMNIRTYIREYPMKGLVLPNLVDIGEVKGSKRLVNRYSGLPIIPMITAKERNGAVLQVSIKAEQFLASHDEGMVVITNPMGWTDLGFDYFSSQTLILKKEENGSLTGVTLVTDMTKDQHKRFLVELGVTPKNLEGNNQMEEIANIVRNPALLSKRTIEDIINKILSIRGYGDIRLQRRNGSTETRAIRGLLEDIKKLPQLLKFNPNCERYIEDFKDFVLANSLNIDNHFIQRRIQQELERTILKITREVMGGERVRAGRLQSVGSEFVRELAYLGTLPGCGGGGTKVTDLRILLGTISFSGPVGRGLEEGGKCVLCGEINSCTKKCYACGGNLINLAS